MPALGIVEPLDVVADRRDCGSPRRVALVVDQLALQRGEEAFCNGYPACDGAQRKVKSQTP